MKKTIILILTVISLFGFISCKGEKGDAGVTGPAGEDIVMAVFQQLTYPDSNYSGVKDTIITDANINYNYGNCGSSGAGAYPSYVGTRALIKFDISGIVPSNVIVTKAELILNLNQVYGTNTYTAYSITKDWIEGTACGGPLAGTCTWNNYGTGAWTNPGGDFNSTPVSNSLIIKGSAPQTITFLLNASMVQSWISNPSTNFGILIKANNEAVENNSIFWNSKENMSTGPMLKVYYKLP